MPLKNDDFVLKNGRSFCNSRYIPGASPGSFNLSQVSSAAAEAAAADLVIAVVGDDGSTAGENHDVDDLDLNGAQLPLLWEVTQATKAPVVVVVVSAQPKTFGAAMWTRSYIINPPPQFCFQISL